MMNSKPKYGFLGSYKSWEDAAKASTGYDSEIILEKAKASLLKVKNGEAVHERDTVLFDEVQYSWPLLAGLMWVAAQSEGKLNVLDFGGSLGSTYFQNRKFIESLHEVRWNVVEQPHFIDTGKKYFENDRLKFYHDMETCLSETSANTIIFSGVLLCLEKPYELLKKAIDLAFDYILIDRTPFCENDQDILRVQKVPPKIFEASYPCWIFSMNKFKGFFSNHEIVAEFHGFESGFYDGYDFKGFIIRNEKGSGNEKV